MQRRRLLAATLELAFEGDLRAVSVAVLCERAGISRRTFYDLFEDREGCVHAAFESSLNIATGAVAEAVAGHRRWRDRVRAGLTALLDLFDREPGMGHLLVIGALGCGPPTLQARRDALVHAASAIDQGRKEAKANRQPPPLTAEGIAGAVHSLVQTHMLEHDPSPLTDLTGPLMALIVHPYLGPAAAQQELEVAPPAKTSPGRRIPTDPFKDLPIRLTYRTACVLTAIAQTPGASSKQIAHESGIADAGQISRLLKRLESHGLIQDLGTGPNKGMTRAWTLTELGEAVLQATGGV
jgi:AcrR family transcriptional regulator